MTLIFIIVNDIGEKLNKSKFHQTSGLYEMLSVNQEIKLTEGQIEFEPKTLKIKGHAQVFMRFIPKLEINIEAIAFEFFEKLMAGEEVEINFPSIKLSVKLFIKKSSISQNYQITAIPYEEPLLIGSTGETKKVVFHILNFPEFYGTSDMIISGKDRIERSGHIILKANGWQIKIIAVRNLKSLFKSLKNEGGYVITHVGYIERMGNSSFPRDKCTKILDALHYFLSFCAGYFTGPILPVGFNESNESIWEEWYCGLKTPYKPVLSWLDTLHGQLLEKVFPGFLNQWQNKIWNESVETAIYWYLRSNTREGGTDGAIILAQTALELLAYTYFVEDKKIWSYVDFKGKSAADKIKLLLSSLDIPLDIPSYLRKLFKLGNKFNWNGPQAFSEVRNFLVHPGQKRKRLAKVKAPLPLIEVWKLGLWYIELVLLHLFEHTGVYAERLKDGHRLGDVVPVPWASE